MVIEGLAALLSKKLKAINPDHPIDAEVLEWQINIYLNYFFTFLLVLICGSLTGKLAESLLAMLAFIIVRKFSGGMHLSSITVCTLLSAAIFSVIPLITISHSWVINSIAAFIFWLYAPSYQDEITGSGKLSDRQIKLICVGLVLSNLVIDSSVLALTFLSQAILVLPILKAGRR